MNQPTRRRAGVLDALQQGLSQPTPPRISIRNAMFTLVDGAGVEQVQQTFDPQFGRYLDVVIIGANPTTSKIYYENEYDPAKDDMPVCFSDNGVGPSSQSSKPQHPTCAGCPNNEWGSDISKMTGKPTKLCSDRKKIAVVVPTDPAQLVYQLQIPPASLKNVAVLANALRTHSVPDEDNPGQTRPCDPADVVTRVYFNAQKQGEILFQPIGFHTQLFPHVNDLIARADQSGVIDVVIGANDRVYQGAIAGPQAAPQIAAPQAMPQTQAPPPPPPMQQAPQFAPQQPMPQAAAPQFVQGQPQAQQPQFQQPAPQQQAPAQEAPRRRRGGARQGAGRPAQAPQQQAPAPQPFQQQAPQMAPQGQPAPFQMHPAQPAPMQPTTPQQAGHVAQPGFPEPPPFLVRPQPGAPAPQAPPGTAYGMTNGAAPDQNLAAALDNAFNMPMQPRAR